MKVEKVKNADGTWTIKNVQIVATGIEYPLSTGPHTFTEDELVAAVEAYHTDPAIKAPRLKLGHTSEFNASATGDGEPAFGTVENLRLSDNQQEIIGDYTAVPEWLALVMPTAYPSRSVDALGGVVTVTGKQHDMVITAVCALGVYWPGCSVLEDLPKWFGSDIPEGAVIEDTESIAAAGGDMKLGRRKGTETIAAEVDTSKIRRTWYQTMGQDNPYWWIRAERYGEGQMYLIAENEAAGPDDDDLFKIPVVVNGDDITFGEAAPVRVDYPEKVAASVIAAGMKVADSAVIIHASRAETSPEETTTQEGGESQVDTKALAQRLGLPEDATEEQINDALDAALPETTVRDSASVPPGEPSPAGQTGTGEPVMQMNDGSATGPKPEKGPAGGAPTAGGPVVIPPPDELQAKIDAGELILVDPGTLQHLKAGADLAVKQDEDARRERVGTLVRAAVVSGKIPRARMQHYEAMAAADYDGTKALLDGLPDNLIPVQERGDAPAGEEEIAAGSDNQGLPDEWFRGFRKPAVVGQVTKAREA